MTYDLITLKINGCVPCHKPFAQIHVTRYLELRTHIICFHIMILTLNFELTLYNYRWSLHDLCFIKKSILN